MGLTDIPKVDADSSIAVALMDMYQIMGDALAHQYGGSAAHNSVFPERQGKWKTSTQSREFLNSIKRYYSNTYTDGEKQDAINFHRKGNLLSGSWILAIIFMYLELEMSSSFRALVIMRGLEKGVEFLLHLFQSAVKISRG